MLKLPDIADEHERRVAGFLAKIGFSFVDSRTEFRKSEAEPAREIDLLFAFQNCLFIIEVSTVKTGRNSKIISFMHRWSRKKNFERLRQKHPNVPNNVMRIFFDLSKDTPENKSQDVEELTEEPGNVIVYKDVFEKLNSNEDVEQAISGLLGPDWLAKTDKFA